MNALTKAFADQGESCIRMGSPFMGKLMEILKENWVEDSDLGRKFANFKGDIGPAGHSLPLRIAGGLHALVLSHTAPDLAAVYPPHTPTDGDLKQQILTALVTHEPFLMDWCDSAPQTNEVRRSAALIVGARVAVQHFDLPLILSELGASGGLNLMWDHYALNIEGHRFGPDAPALTLTPDWTGPMPPDITPQIAGRAGVDLNPLNPSRGADLLRLTAYLWPDQPERLVNTRAAAAITNAEMTRGDAIDWLAPRLHSAPQGHLHLIQHTVAWQYFPPDVQARGKALMEAAGTQATPNRPLAWLAMESDGDTTAKRGAALTLRLWPGDITMELGRADFHGRWITWNGAERA
ncbi:MAG: DUF2332 domain-containing protein [Sulfitobacter sp.]